jgi:predicted ester cyclase
VHWTGGIPCHASRKHFSDFGFFLLSSASSITFEEAGLPLQETSLRENFVHSASALFPTPPTLTPRQTAEQKFGGLTGREREVAARVAQGKSNRELAAFPDTHVTTDDLLAEGDKVIERWTLTCTHTGVAFMGAPAGTGKKVQTTGISIYRVANGKIVEHWANMDFFGVLAQLGVIPMPGL